MSGRLPRLAGVVATVETADLGYFYGASVFGVLTSAAVIVSAINQTILYQFVLPFRAVVRRIVSEVTTGGGASKLYGVGLYDVDGNRILTTGALDANTTQVNNTSVIAVTLEPGIYYQGQTSDSATTQLRVLNWQGAQMALLNQGTLKGVGGGNASSAGVLPATMGTISASTIRLPAAVIFAS